MEVLNTILLIIFITCGTHAQDKDFNVQKQDPNVVRNAVPVPDAQPGNQGKASLQGNAAPAIDPRKPAIGNNIVPANVAKLQPVQNVDAGRQQPGQNDNMGRPPLMQNNDRLNARPIQQQRIPDKRGRGRPRLPVGLATSLECGEEVQRICGEKNFLSNLEVLACMTNAKLVDGDISPKCHQHLWDYKLNITKDVKFTGVAREICKVPLDKYPDCANLEDTSGKLIPCLIDHKNDISTRVCYHFLVKMSTIIFSDFRLICNFVEDCQSDIINNKCGKVDESSMTNTEDQGHHSQGSVVSCLEEVIVAGNDVAEKCAKQIVRLSELSSDDFHLDRNLYFACQDDRERLCEDIPAGDGQVYKCLFQHKFDHQMTSDCHDALTTRQKLIAQDYKASYELQKFCRKDIDDLGCQHEERFQVGATNDHNDVIGLSGMLLCLEAAKRGELTTQHEISPECEEQLVEFRQMLSEDYQMSPEIIANCASEVSHCSTEGLKKRGETIHCLMRLAQTGGDDGEQIEFSQKCENALMHLLKEEQVVNDYRMDYALATACNPVIETLCSNHKEGDPMVLSCLMENLHSKGMVEVCEKRLLELQYFISRDFFLDTEFFKKCHSDAKNLCDVEGLKNTDQNELNMPYSLVVSCLYRHISGKAKGKIDHDKETSRTCAEEVRKAMKHRALEFHLNPDLEEACRTSLGKYCSSNVAEKGMELVCLQDSFENITRDQDSDAIKCVEKLEEVTEIEEAEAGRLDNILLRACELNVQKYCRDERDNGEEGAVMQCLIQHKYELNKDCQAGVTHFQLIELKDIKFSYNFMKSCKPDIESLCPDVTKPQVNSKNEVVECLSNKHLQSIVEKQPSPLSEECQAQLTVENLEKHTEYKLNPTLKKSCQEDYRRFCKGKSNAPGDGIECLRRHDSKLTPKCRKVLFKNIEREEVIDPQLDVNVARACKGAIKKFCNRHGAEKILDCLIHNKDLIDDECYDIIEEREREEFSDINLNPELSNACKVDITTHCIDALKSVEEVEKEGGDLTGKVIECLKDFELNGDAKKALTKSCSKHIRFIIEEEEKDYSLDPVLTLNCYDSIQKLCRPEAVPDVVECLKHSYFKNLLQEDRKCMMEVARLLREGRFDILADPVLHNLCHADIQHYCGDVAEGKGRIMSCIMDAIDDGKPIGKDCAEAMLQRKEMWKFAAEHGMDSLKGIARAVMMSPHHSYILTIMTAILIFILLFGMMCGRMTKRISRQRKMV